MPHGCFRFFSGWFWSSTTDSSDYTDFSGRTPCGILILRRPTGGNLTKSVQNQTESGEAPVGTSLFSGSLFEREINQKLNSKINQKLGRTPAAYLGTESPIGEKDSANRTERAAREMWACSCIAESRSRSTYVNAIKLAWIAEVQPILSKSIKNLIQKSNSKSKRCALKSVRTPTAYLFLGSLFEREINQNYSQN